jgi:hypothetical protein
MTIGSLRIAVIGGLTAALALRPGINMAPNATRILRQHPSPREKELRGFLASPPYRDGRSPEPFFGSLGHAQRVARRRDPHKESRAGATRIAKNFGSIAAVERGNLL